MFHVKISEATEVKFRGIWPPINEMDNSLSYLKACVLVVKTFDGNIYIFIVYLVFINALISVTRTLSLSKNMIEKISHLQGLPNLKVLSLAQNKIKSLSGLVSNILRL